MVNGGEDSAARAAATFRVPRLLRGAEVLCGDGRLLRGRVFLPASAEGHSGPMRIDEWMNDPQPFFPFLPDGEGRPAILNKHEIVALTVAESHGGTAGEDAAEVPICRVAVECGSLRLVGDVRIDMPAHQARVLDLLNRGDAFLMLRDGGHQHFVRKARISRVVELLEPAASPA